MQGAKLLSNQKMPDNADDGEIEPEDSSREEEETEKQPEEAKVSPEIKNE